MDKSLLKQIVHPSAPTARAPLIADPRSNNDLVMFSPVSASVLEGETINFGAGAERAWSAYWLRRQRSHVGISGRALSRDDYLPSD
jgi:hypothetical protein